MRLIDSDELKAYIDAQKGRPFIGCTVGEALKIMTDEQPTIDAVPVIRCRDCIHQRKSKDMPYGYCDFFKECEPLGEDFNYCSMGRRKK